MKQRNLLYVVGLLVLVLVCVLLLKKTDETVESESPTKLERKVIESDIAEFKENKSRVDRLRNAPKREFHFEATELAQPPKEAQKIEYPKFRAGGSGTRGSIRDQEGKLIRRATPESPAFGITISPNERLIWVDGGSRKSYIINAQGEEIALLPKTPPGKDMLGFGKWVWLDNNRLLGESGVQNFDENGKPIGCCQGHNMSESRFYVYDLRTNKMEEMRLPKNLRGKVVSIGKVLKTGELQLGHEGDGFGWYQVADLGEGDR